ncbi:hypothetical protein TNCV_1505341 [Trichonephila clavipes]|nr:hypothetical protein TNCV_1505341 [Trichonephila clavipes]
MLQNIIFMREEASTTDLLGVSNELSLHSVGEGRLVSDISNYTLGPGSQTRLDLSNICFNSTVSALALKSNSSGNELGNWPGQLLNVPGNRPTTHKAFREIAICPNIRDKHLFKISRKEIQERCRSHRQTNLEVNSDDVQQLLDSHHQELTFDEFIEKHEQAQDIKELESLDFNQKLEWWLVI